MRTSTFVVAFILIAIAIAVALAGLLGLGVAW